MTKRHKPGWGYTASGTTVPFPLNTEWFNEIPILLAYDETSTEYEFEKELQSILEKVPFWVDRSDLINRLKAAYRNSEKDGFYADEETHLIRLKRFKKEVATIAENEYEKKFELLEEMLDANLSIDDRKALNEVTNKFLMFKATNKPPSLNMSKAVCKEITKALDDAIKILNKINTKEDKTKDRLCSISPRASLYLTNIEVLIDGLESISQAAERIKQKKSTDKDNGRPFKHSPLWTLIADLIPIYEKVTGKKATASAGQYSTFVKFIIRCIELVFEIDEGLPVTQKQSKKHNRPSEYSQGIINNTAVEVIALLKLKDRQKRSIGDNIPFTETGEGMLKALHDVREKNEKEELDFIKNLKKR